MPIPIILLLMYALLTVVILLTILPVYNAVYSFTKDNYIDNYSKDLNDGVIKMDNIIYDIILLRSANEQNPYYSDFKLDKDKNHSTQYYYRLMKCKNDTSYGLRLLEKCTESIILFTSNGTVITKNYVFDDVKSAFGDYMAYDGYTSDEIVQKIIMVSNENGFISENMVDFFGTKKLQCITLVNKKIDDSVIYGVLLSDSNIADIFGLNSMPEDTFLYITSPNKSIAMGINYVYDKPLDFEDNMGEVEYIGKKYTVISKKFSLLNLSITVGIPDSFFTNKLDHLVSLYIRYSIYALFIGLILGVVFSIYNYVPLKKLKELAMKGKYVKSDDNTNIYNYLEEVILKSSVANQNLERTIKSMKYKFQCNMFIRMLHGTLLKEEDQKLAQDILPQVNDSYFIAIVRYADYEKKKSTDFYDNWLYDMLLDNLKNDHIISHIDWQTIAILIPNSEKNYNTFLTTVYKINLKTIELFDQKLNIAISDGNKGIDGVYIAFNHAYHMIGIDNQLLIKEYRLHQELQTEDVLSRKAIQNLYKYIISGDINTIKNEMHNISLSLNEISSHEKVYQTYYAIRFVLEDVMEDLSVKQSIPNYNSKASIQELIEQLYNCAILLANDITVKSSSINEQKKIGIIRYINDNYHDPNIYAGIISEEFNCSVKYVYKVVRECTGKSLNSYIEALRMQCAIELLKNTNKNIATISNECGYNSTNNFYKAFKKHYGNAPGFYRKILID